MAHSLLPRTREPKETGAGINPIAQMKKVGPRKAPKLITDRIIIKNEDVA